MEINLKPELEQFLQEKLNNGQYNTLDEAINEGVELLKRREEIYQGRFEELQKEIMIGLTASERGEVIDGELLFQNLNQKLEFTKNFQKNG